MRSEIRKPYRVAPGQEIAATVKNSVGEFSVQVLDVSQRGVRICLPREKVPPLALGHSVTVIFSSQELSKPVPVEAVVLARFETDGLRHYDCRFHEQEALEHVLSGQLHQIFNRRGAFRAEPQPEEAIEVILEVSEKVTKDPSSHAGEMALTGGGNHVSARLLDISATGVMVLTETKVESILAAIERVEFSLRLPRVEGALRLVGWIRRRWVTEGNIQYGIEFDSEATPEFQRLLDEITDYIMRRQREELQNRARLCIPDTPSEPPGLRFGGF